MDSTYKVWLGYNADQPPDGTDSPSPVELDVTNLRVSTSMETLSITLFQFSVELLPGRTSFHFNPLGI